MGRATCGQAAWPERGPVITDAEFGRLGSLIKEFCGIKLSSAKKATLSYKVAARMAELGVGSFGRYVDRLHDDGGELGRLINLVCTNKTEFFREPAQFGFLTTEALPRLLAESASARLGGVRIWSAGCSSGEEPYTIAITLSDYREHRHGFAFFVTGTDISTKALAQAARAVYPEDVVARQVPRRHLERYFLRGRGRHAGLCRVAPEIRDRVRLARLNLMEGSYGLGQPMHVIFCRNVMIYFDRRTQGELASRLHAQVAPGGYLFLGYSETLGPSCGLFERVAPSVYRRS